MTEAVWSRKTWALRPRPFPEASAIVAAWGRFALLGGVMDYQTGWPIKIAMSARNTLSLPPGVTPGSLREGVGRRRRLRERPLRKLHP